VQIERVLTAASALAIALAVALRVSFLGRKPFWSDEAWVASLAEMPIRRLLSTIAHTTAPVGFALAVKLTSLIPGLRPEIAMRLLPLAAGIATVVLLPRLVRALGGSQRAATLAALVAAAMPALVHYSRELKPYAIDAFIATAFPLASLRLIAAEAGDGQPARRRAARALPAAMAFFTPLFSFGGVFPVAATLAWGWVHLLRRGLGSAWRPWAAASGAFLFLLGGAAFTLIYRQATNPVLTKFFKADAPGSGLSIAVVAGSLTRLFETMAGHLFPGAAPVGLLAAAIGFVAWPRSGRGAAVGIAGGSVVLAALAAAADLYAVNYGRLVLFAAPFAVAAVCVGFDRSLEWIVRPARLQSAAAIAALLLAGSLAAFWTVRDIAHRLHPERSNWRTSFLYDGLQDVPALVEEAVRRRGPGEPVLVAHTIKWSMHYYARGRLSELFEVRGRGEKRNRKAVEGWLPSVPERGWLLLTSEVASDRLREAIARSGFAIVSETPFRLAVLWEVRRRADPG
jgi:hypothetical protein